MSTFDQITIGGALYSVNQIIDKTIVANADVVLYPSLFSDQGKFTVKAGQPIGKVFSYLMPGGSNPTSKVVLQFERSYNNFYWLKDDRAIDVRALKDQGSHSVAEELEAEREAAEREASPVAYYVEKYGLRALLISGGIYLLAQLGKEVLRASKVTQEVTNETSIKSHTI